MDDNQIDIPASFIALFVPPGRIKPTLLRAQIAQRYETSEDLAQLLVETVQAKVFDLGITREDALERVRRGLATLPDLSEQEAWWVGRRLEELVQA